MFPLLKSRTEDATRRRTDEDARRDGDEGVQREWDDLRVPSAVPEGLVADLRCQLGSVNGPYYSQDDEEGRHIKRRM